MPQSWSVVAPVFKEGRLLAFPLQQTEGRASRLCCLQEENRKYKVKALYVRQEMGLTMDTLPVTYHREPRKNPKCKATSEDGGVQISTSLEKEKIEDRLLRLISGDMNAFRGR